ncbi:MAG: OmpP1/FadL family transporter [Oligoflexus sp.]
MGLNKKTKQISLAIITSGLVTSPLLGAGFSIRVQSAQSLGTGYAAEGTAKHPSLIFSNPALIGSFEKHEFSLGLASVMPDIDFKDGKRTIPGTSTDAADPLGSVSDITPSNSIVPTLAGVHPVADRVNIGWTFTAPFATNSDYGEEWVGRYHSTKTKLQVLNLDVAASYKINEQFTVGLGVQVQKGSGLIGGASNGGAAVVGAGVRSFQSALAARAGGDSSAYNALSGIGGQIKTAFEQGLADAQQNGQDPTSADVIESVATTAAQTVAGAALQQLEGRNDIIAEYEGESIGYGFVAGLTYDPTPELRLGLSYRSSVKHKTQGDITVTGNTDTANAVVQSLGLAPGVAVDGDLSLVLPDSVLLGVSYEVIPNLTLYSSFTYTMWSSIDSLNVIYKTIDRNILVKLDFEDTLAIGLGGEYRLSEVLRLRFGAASDPTPTTDKLRSPRSPDNDRTVISLGAGYVAKNWSVDAALAHYIFKDPTLQLDENDYPEAKADGRGNLTGTYSASVNTFMLQFGYQI